MICSSVNLNRFIVCPSFRPDSNQAWRKIRGSGQETTIHQISDCSLKAQDGLPARLLIQNIDVTLNLSQADHMQVISIIRDNSNWGATRMFNGEGWLDRGQPSTPIVSEWGEVIRVEARLTSN